MAQLDTARLLIACDDQPGIVAAVAHKQSKRTSA